MGEERHVVLDDGSRLWTIVDGGGPPVIACHGGPGLWDYLEPLAAMLVDDATVVRFDQRGCGRSDAYDGTHSIDQAVDDLDRVRRAHGFEEVGLLGHSWGAELVLRYAARHPDHVRAVAYVAGVGAYDDFLPGYRAELEVRLGDDLPRWRELAAISDRTPEQEHEFCLLQWRPDFSPSSDTAAHAASLWASRPPGAGVDRRANRELWADRPTEDLVQLAAQVRAPVLMLLGADDPRPWHAANAVHDALSDVRRVVLDGAGHAPWVERPEAVRDLLVEALGPEAAC